MKEAKVEFSARASLVAYGVRFRQMGIWKTVSSLVRIKQKKRDHSPMEKLLDALINILAGGAGLVEINTRVRPDQAVQRAFGRSGCAEQSTVSDTLNACTADNVRQMRQAVSAVLRAHGGSFQHNHWQSELLLDADVTGLPAGRGGEGCSKGYFAGKKNRRGRQLGRVLATDYDEIVVDCLADGKRQLNRSLPGLLTEAATALRLDAAKRRTTIVRVDGGAGDDANINWVLNQGYHLLTKMTSWQRAHKLSETVTAWYRDTKVSDREAGWVESPLSFARPTRQLLVRTPKSDGTPRYHLLVLTLSDAMLFRLAGQAPRQQPTPRQQAHLTLAAYDRRNGGLETHHKSDKQGLALGRRNKRNFAAQEMLVLLAQLAHNFVIWARNDLAQATPRLRKFGIQRTVRDAFQIAGRVTFSKGGQIQQITLNESHPLAAAVQAALGDDLSLNLGKI
jgi:hypothetical protein